jgi:hypothetical protein
MDIIAKLEEENQHAMNYKTMVFLGKKCFECKLYVKKALHVKRDFFFQH